MDVRPALKVFHLAYKAVPFVAAAEARGLAEVAGRFPAAEKQFGLNSGLVLPFFRPTAEAIDRLGLRDQLKLVETYPVDPLFPESSPVAKVWKMGSPLGYPVYFIENEKYSGLSEMYGQPNDLEIAFAFADSALKLFPRLGSAPDAVVLHDWQLASFAARLAQQVNYFKSNYYNETKLIGFMHEPNFQGRFTRETFSQAKMGWEHQLPPWVEFWRDINMLKALLYLSDISLARSASVIDNILAGTDAAGFHGIAHERFKAGKLVALAENDCFWSPDKELSAEAAVQAVRREIMAFRSVIATPFVGQEQAESTEPPVRPKHFTPLEIFRGLHQDAYRLIAELAPSDRSTIEQAIKAGQGERFAKSSSSDRLKQQAAFLRLAPTCNFEAELTAAGLGGFLRYFQPRDLDRLLSVELPLVESRNEELLAKTGGSASLTVTIYEILKLTNIMPHNLAIFKLLDFILRAKDLPELELRREIELHQLPASPADIWTLSLRFRDLSVSMMRPFIVAVLLHDLGKFIRGQKHDLHGRRLLLEEPLRGAVLGLLDDPGLELTGHYVAQHLIFGMFALHEIGKYDRIIKLWSTTADPAQRKILLDGLFLISIPDCHDRGGIKSDEFRRLRALHEAVIVAQDPADLKTRLDQLGFGKRSKGKSRWDLFVVRSDGSKIGASEKAAVEKERQRYRASCRLKLDDFFATLGSFNIFPVRLFDHISSPIYRARLFIFLVDLFREQEFEAVGFELTRKDHAALNSLLGRFDLAQLRQFIKKDQTGEIVFSLQHRGK